MKGPRLEVVTTFLLVSGALSILFGQQPASREAKVAHKPFKAQSTSEINFRAEGDEESIEIENSVYEVSVNPLPGRPPDERLVIRKKIRTKEILGDIGTEGTTTVEAWPFGADLSQKPLYAISVAGSEAQTVDGALIEVSRGLEEVEWWSVYKLGTGEHLFDTYVPLVRFSISRETVKERYVGLEVPPDDAADPRLRESHVVGVLTYASPERVIREALLTCDDPNLAALLRSFADETRTVSASDTARSIKISFSQNYPSPPATVSVVIPITKDDLDLTHAQLPARLHAAAWKR